MDLLLLDPNTGRPVNACGKSIPDGAVANDFLNILILSVRSRTGFSQVTKNQMKKDQASIVRQLYKTSPFGEKLYRAKVNVFTPKKQPTLEPLHSNLVREFYLREKLEPIVKTYQFGSFIVDGHVWLWTPAITGLERSEGCIGIVSGLLSDFGLFHRRVNPPNAPPRWARDKGAAQQSIGYFGLASPYQPTGSKSRKLRRKDLGRTFVHELGHALYLHDEYEHEIPDGAGGWFTSYGRGREEAPNVISKNEIVTTPAMKTSGLWPSDEFIDPSKIPWERMISVLAILPTVQHKSRDISKIECTTIHLRTYHDVGKFCQLFDDSEEPATGFIGLYEGGDLNSFDVYRPDKGCRMRVSSAFNQGYCGVCKEWIRYRISSQNFEGSRDGFKSWLLGVYP